MKTIKEIAAMHRDVIEWDHESISADDVEVCPWCGARYEDICETPEGENDCSECGGTYDIVANYSVSFTITRMQEPKEGAG